MDFDEATSVNVVMAEPTAVHPRSKYTAGELLDAGLGKVFRFFGVTEDSEASVVDHDALIRAGRVAGGKEYGKNWVSERLDSLEGTAEKIGIEDAQWMSKGENTILKNLQVVIYEMMAVTAPIDKVVTEELADTYLLRFFWGDAMAINMRQLVEIASLFKNRIHMITVGCGKSGDEGYNLDVQVIKDAAMGKIASVDLLWDGGKNDAVHQDGADEPSLGAALPSPPPATAPYSRLRRKGRVASATKRKHTVSDIMYDQSSDGDDDDADDDDYTVSGSSAGGGGRRARITKKQKSIRPPTPPPPPTPPETVTGPPTNGPYVANGVR